MRANTGFFRNSLWVSVAFAVFIATVIGLTSFGNADVAEADNVPGGCLNNLLVLSLLKNVATTGQGGVVEYQVIVQNPSGGSGCLIDGAEVSFTEPAADGTATGTRHVLGTALSFAPDGSDDTCWRSNSGLACPGGTTEVINANLSHTVAVNQGVNSIVAMAELTGPGGAGSADLHDSSGDSEASALKTVTVDILPDVHVEKSADNSPIVAGDTASFTITTSNAGPSVATNLVMTDNLPGTGWVENPDNPFCVIAAEVLTCTYDRMEAGDSDPVTVERPTTTADCGIIPNIADVVADNEDPDHTGDNSDDATIIVDCPDVATA